MKKERFKELEERNKNSDMKLCYQIFCEEKKVIPIQLFNEYFTIWTDMFKGGNIKSCIEYFKTNKVK